MFNKLLAVGALTVALIGGIGTASASGMRYICGGQEVIDHEPVSGTNEMWVVNPYRNFSQEFIQDGKKWNFHGPILHCGTNYWAGRYVSS
ncbi:hypothetical protein WDV76_10495 [Xenorhabdus griffiniae]|uniref:hypothetical protein n=1 Tax=Xenorhabdus griffiniae TaxID=351672 RepID=UPI0030CFCCBA